LELLKLLKEVESVASHDKLKRIGHQNDKLKRIGHLVAQIGVPLAIALRHFRSQVSDLKRDYSQIQVVAHRT